MATSMLLRSLSRRVLHSTTSTSTFRCLNARSLWAATSPLHEILSSRTFSSKSDGNDVATEFKNATNQGDVVTNPANPSSNKMCSSAADDVEFKIVEYPDGDVRVEFSKLGSLLQSLSQICPMIFTIFKKHKESSTGRPLSKAVILVPSYFNEAQRHAAENAAIVSGFDVHKVIVNEPSQDSFPYGIKGNCLITVLDLSGGTFNFYVRDLLRPESSDTLLEHIVSELLTHGYDVTEDPWAHQRLEEAVERAFINNSSGIKIHIPVAAGEPENTMIFNWTKCE